MKNAKEVKDVTCKSDEDNLVALSDELGKVKEELEQKSHLLDKVKVLLHRAAAKEKALLQEVNEFWETFNLDGFLLYIFLDIWVEK